MTGTRFHFVLPGPPETPTGGFVYDCEMLRALAGAGRLAGRVVLPGGFPRPSAAALDAAARVVAALPDGAQVVVDGLALTPLAEAAALTPGRLQVHALIHHPLADETGLAPAEQARLHAAERRALSRVAGVVVTSAHTARRLTGLGVPGTHIRVVRPGVMATAGGRSPAAARRRRGGSAPVLLCVASLTPRKGQDLLLRALAALRPMPWRLRLVGPVRDRAFAGRLRRLARSLRLADRVEFAGAVGAASLARHYRTADLFVLPSHYEGFGIAVAEAAAHGLPVVTTNAGALPEAAAGARHVLVPPGDAAALARALRPFLSDHPAGPLLAPCPRARPRRWDAAGREFIAALDALAAADAGT